jgi:hypothetical protein
MKIQKLQKSGKWKVVVRALNYNFRRLLQTPHERNGEKWKSGKAKKITFHKFWKFNAFSF